MGLGGLMQSKSGMGVDPACIAADGSFCVPPHLCHIAPFGLQSNSGLGCWTRVARGVGRRNPDQRWCSRALGEA